MTEKSQYASPKLYTPPARISYPFLFAARMPLNPKPTDEARYSCVLMFNEEAEGSEEFKLMKQEIVNCAIAKWGEAELRRLVESGEFRRPFRHDIAKKNYPEDVKSYIRPWTKTKPGVVDRFADPQDPKKAAVIVDPGRIYPGCWVRATVRPFAYDTMGQKGVQFSLENVQFLDDGPRIAGREDAQEAFAPLAPAPLAAMPGMAASSPAPASGANVQQTRGALEKLLG